MLIATMVTHFMSGRQELNIDSLDRSQWHYASIEFMGKIRPGQNVNVYCALSPCTHDLYGECSDHHLPLLSDLLD